MTLFKRWRTGMGLGLRLVLLGILCGIIMFPTKILEVLPPDDEVLRGGLVFAYLFAVVPLFLPLAMETCGLGGRSSGEFDLRGGMNESSRRKTEELAREAEARRKRQI